jgi:hypothetical protein
MKLMVIWRMLTPASAGRQLTRHSPAFSGGRSEPML